MLILSHRRRKQILQMIVSKQRGRERSKEDCKQVGGGKYFPKGEVSAIQKDEEVSCDKE